MGGRRIHREPQWGKEMPEQTLIFHIPHAALLVPPAERLSLVISEAQLEIERLKMTDWYTDEIFSAAAVAGDEIVAFPVSRLVLDPERFVDDEHEPMASRGMGVVYTRCHDRTVLRDNLDEKDRLVETYFVPHHRRLEDAVERHLVAHGRAIIIDCHSFPSSPLPHERVQDPIRPQICIGTDATHTPEWLRDGLLGAFDEAGYSVDVNTPFDGSLVPMRYYGKEPLVQSVMIELRRDIYMDETSALRNDGFLRAMSAVQKAIAAVRRLAPPGR